jgi:hypothetical protein
LDGALPTFWLMGLSLMGLEISALLRYRFWVSCLPAFNARDFGLEFF